MYANEHYHLWQNESIVDNYILSKFGFFTISIDWNLLKSLMCRTKSPWVCRSWFFASWWNVPHCVTDFGRFGKLLVWRLLHATRVSYRTLFWKLTARFLRFLKFLDFFPTAKGKESPRGHDTKAIHFGQLWSFLAPGLDQSAYCIRLNITLSGK